VKGQHPRPGGGSFLGERMAVQDDRMSAAFFEMPSNGEADEAPAHHDNFCVFHFLSQDKSRPSAARGEAAGSRNGLCSPNNIRFSGSELCDGSQENNQANRTIRQHLFRNDPVVSTNFGFRVLLFLLS